MRLILDLLLRIGVLLLLRILYLMRMVFWCAVTLFGVTVTQIHARNDILSLLAAATAAAAGRIAAVGVVFLRRRMLQLIWMRVCRLARR